jgi:hypothetical protein
MSLSTPFGGLIYFESPGPGSIYASLNNVVESPFIDLTKAATIEDWPRRRQSSGLWVFICDNGDSSFGFVSDIYYFYFKKAELAGANIIFTTPSECIRKLENPVDILKFWDKVCETHHQ